MEASVRLYHLSQARLARPDRQSRIPAQARDRWPMSFALLVWVAVSELAWYGIFKVMLAAF